MKKLALSASALLLIIISLLFTACHKAQMTNDGCYVNMEEAAKVAASKKKDLIVLATVENGDALSSNFLNMVVRTSDFASDFLKQYIVVHLDLSEGINNYASLLNVSVTPSVYLLSKEGYYLDSFVFTEEFHTYGDFKKYFDGLQTTLVNKKALISAAQKGKPLDKLNSINVLYDATPVENRVSLLPLLAAAQKLDKANVSGLRGKMIYAYVDAAAIKAMSEGNIEETVRLYFTLEKESLVDAELRQQAIYTAAYICAMTQTKTTSEIIEYLQKAISVNPDGKEVPGIQRVIDALREQN